MLNLVGVVFDFKFFYFIENENYTVKDDNITQIFMCLLY